MCNGENATWNASSSDNGTASRPYEPNTVAIYAQFAAILSLVVVTVTGNLLLLAIVFRSRQLLSTVSNALIVNLAVADCLVGVFILPAFAATVLRGSTAAAPGLCSAWKDQTAWGVAGHQPGPRLLGPGLCSAFGVVAVVLSSESLLTLGAIAVDRYLNICHPLVYMRLAESHKMVVLIGL